MRLSDSVIYDMIVTPARTLVLEGRAASLSLIPICGPNRSTGKASGTQRVAQTTLTGRRGRKRIEVQLRRGGTVIGCHWQSQWNPEISTCQRQCHPSAVIKIQPGSLTQQCCHSLGQRPCLTAVHTRVAPGKGDRHPARERFSPIKEGSLWAGSQSPFPSVVCHPTVNRCTNLQNSTAHRPCVIIQPALEPGGGAGDGDIGAGEDFGGAYHGLVIIDV